MMGDLMSGNITWADVEVARGNVIDLFPRDLFFKKICKGGLRAGRDKTNPIRGNLVASALRGLATHVLHSFAPDAEVRRCVWLEQAADAQTVTRGQRARYIVQAGLPNDFMNNELKIDVGSMAKPLLAAMDSLHKATHVRAETVVYKPIRPEVRDQSHPPLVVVGIVSAYNFGEQSLRVIIRESEPAGQTM